MCVKYFKFLAFGFLILITACSSEPQKNDGELILGHYACNEIDSGELINVKNMTMSYANRNILDRQNAYYTLKPESDWNNLELEQQKTLVTMAFISEYCTSNGEIKFVWFEMNNELVAQANKNNIDIIKHRQ